MTNTPTQPAMPLEVALVWGAFLHEGLMDCPKMEKALLQAWHRGCIELVNQACSYLPLVWDEYSKQIQPDDLPIGIMEYEVISVFGYYLGDSVLNNGGKFPPENEIKATIQMLVFCYLDPAQTAITA